MLICHGGSLNDDFPAYNRRKLSNRNFAFSTFPKTGFWVTSAQMTNQYALILAGGSGTRFWPLSRDNKPKQLLNLFGSGTLLEQTIARLEGLIPNENIFILTSALQVDEVRKIASSLPVENIFAEPAKRDTGPAVALGIGLIAARNPDAVMMVLPADQLIQDVDAYQSVMRDAITIAEKSESLVTIGIRPTWPCPSYGYIERGESADLPGIDSVHSAFEVKRFREKPDTALAETFLNTGGFSWNAGMFVWSLDTVTKQLSNHSKELAEFVTELRDSSDIETTVANRFPSLNSISIDYALMETADRVLNIEATFDWDDVGSWISIAKYLTDIGENNRTNHPFTHLDSENNIIFNDTPETHIALLGVDDLIVVQTGDSILIANRHQADAIKKLSKLLPENLL